jgi:hypothetical protein
VHLARSCIELQTTGRVPSPPTYDLTGPSKVSTSNSATGFCCVDLHSMQVIRRRIELSPRAEGVGVESQDRVESWCPSCITLDGESNWGERVSWVLSDHAGNRESEILLGINVGTVHAW